MQRRINTQASSLVILLSILTILLQFFFYYLFTLNVVILGIACLISVVCCHILLVKTSNYRICFDYSLLSLFISLVIIVLTYQGNTQNFLPYSNTMIGIAFINWLLPMLYCLIRYMFDYSSKADDFNDFYRYSSILFVLFYIGILVYGNFAGNAFPWAYQSGSGATNFIPFQIISNQLEDFIYDSYALNDIIIYLACRILIFIPYGFYLTILMRKQKRLFRYSILLVLPLLIETLQYFIIPQRFDVDDLIYGLLGGLLGCFVFFLTNIIFRAVSGNDFLSKDSSLRGYHSYLHF